MKKNISIKSTLRRCAPEIKAYVSELEAVNKRLHQQLARLKVQVLDKDNDISGLEKELKKRRTVVNFSITGLGKHKRT